MQHSFFVEDLQMAASTGQLLEEHESSRDTQNKWNYTKAKKSNFTEAVLQRCSCEKCSEICSKFKGEHLDAEVWFPCRCKGLLLKPGPGLWTQTLINLDPETPDLEKYWPKKLGPWKTWILENME